MLDSFTGSVIAERRNGARALFDMLGPQPETRAGRERNFFIFFARNSLKGFDSEKFMKTNESYFFLSLAFIGLHLFAEISR